MKQVSRVGGIMSRDWMEGICWSELVAKCHQVRLLCKVDKMTKVLGSDATPYYEVVSQSECKASAVQCKCSAVQTVIIVTWTPSRHSCRASVQLKRGPVRSSPRWQQIYGQGMLWINKSNQCGPERMKQLKCQCRWHRQSVCLSLRLR